MADWKYGSDGVAMYPYSYPSIENRLRDAFRCQSTHSQEHDMPAKKKTRTATELLDILAAACEASTVDKEAVYAIVELVKLGFEVSVNPALAHGDRKGYSITIIEPMKENANVQPSKK